MKYKLFLDLGGFVDIFVLLDRATLTQLIIKMKIIFLLAVLLLCGCFCDEEPREFTLPEKELFIYPDQDESYYLISNTNDTLNCSLDYHTNEIVSLGCEICICQDYEEWVITNYWIGTKIKGIRYSNMASMDGKATKMGKYWNISFPYVVADSIYLFEFSLHSTTSLIDNIAHNFELRKLTQIQPDGGDQSVMNSLLEYDSDQKPIRELVWDYGGWLYFYDFNNKITYVRN